MLEQKDRPAELRCVARAGGRTHHDRAPIRAIDQTLEQLAATARNQQQRLVERELVYVGATRTPVCALIASAPLRGPDCPVAAEHFAIAADAHVWLGRLDSAEYRCATPDGAPTTRAACRIRLARVVCA